MVNRDSTGQIMKQEDKSLVKHITALLPQVEKALPKHVDPERMLRVMMGSLRRTPKLNDCEPLTVLGCMMQCAVLGLEPDNGLGHAYLIPYGRVATLIVGYKGMVDLARRSGQVSTITAEAVYEGDHFDFELGLNPILAHRPGETDRMLTDKITHVYAVCTLRDGGKQFDVMTRAEVDAIRKRSRAGSSGPWCTDFKEMAKKTVLRRLCKLLPTSIEMQQAVAMEEMTDAGLTQRHSFDTGVTAMMDSLPPPPPEEKKPPKKKAEKKAKPKEENPPANPPKEEGSGKEEPKKNNDPATDIPLTEDEVRAEHIKSIEIGEGFIGNEEANAIRERLGVKDIEGMPTVDLEKWMAAIEKSANS